jgi:hypothetical protein
MCHAQFRGASYLCSSRRKLSIVLGTLHGLTMMPGHFSASGLDFVYGGSELRLPKVVSR